MLKRNLDPRDFLDSEARVTDWIDFDGHRCRAYRIWICRSGIFWFQRHEWLMHGDNHSTIDPWLQTNSRSFGALTMPAPDEDG